MVDHHAVSRLTANIGAIVAFILAACSCGSPLPSDAKARPLSGLLLICEPDDALLYVDDKFMGTVAGLNKRPLALADGLHRIELRRDGYFAHYAEIRVERGVRQKLHVKLRKELF